MNVILPCCCDTDLRAYTVADNAFEDIMYNCLPYAYIYLAVIMVAKYLPRVLTVNFIFYC